MPHSVTLRVSGARACFSRAEFKTERVSYDVITPSAARGIFDSVYWQPRAALDHRPHPCPQADLLPVAEPQRDR
ncbi:CRISPR-associated protein Cas5 [Azospirillum aestuarii]|uniref:CRISPR-associated protein Cas5 n=1 Tax=Azospirillum aestuarii TaxID=2802052 RepID=UPI0031F3068D